jgi:hypothetical protein
LILLKMELGGFSRRISRKTRWLHHSPTLVSIRTSRIARATRVGGAFEKFCTPRGDYRRLLSRIYRRTAGLTAGWRKVRSKRKNLCASPNHDKGEQGGSHCHGYAECSGQPRRCGLIHVKLVLQCNAPSTSDDKRLRANTHNDERSYNSRNRLRLLLPHHSMHADARDD